MKRLMMIALVLIVGLGLVGCSSKKEDLVGDDVTIRYWQHSSPARDAMIKNIVEKFMVENPNIKVELEFIPEADYDQKLVTVLASGNSPDVFQVQSGMINKLAKAESIVPLDERVMSKEYIETEFIQATIDGLKVDDKYYGMPTDTQTIIALWNKDLYEKAGLDPEKGPETWDELFERARLLTERNGDMMTQSGWGTKGYAPEAQAIVEQYGGKFFDNEKGEYVFADDPKSVAALTDMANAYRVDKVYDEAFSKNWAGFRQGIVGQMLGHPAMIGNLKETAPDLNLGLGTIPMKDSNGTTIITSWAYVMSKDAQTAAATTFIEYLSSEEVGKIWTLETGELPSRKALLEDKDLLANPQLAIALKSLDQAAVGHLQNGALYSIWGQHYQRIMHTDEPIETILKDAQKALNDEYKK